MIARKIGGYISLCAVFLMAGCATTAELNDRYADNNGMQRLEFVSDLPQVVYQNQGKDETNWHIYIEGDGKPWLNRNTIAENPSTVKPLMLRLMARDTAPSFYIGRPCYNLHKDSAKCHPYYWTHGRYSEPVIDSTTAVINRLVSMNNINQLTLIGHSGGGTLAMLLAERIPETKTVVTLAGNLDIEAWANAHGYSRLQGSLNPAQRKPLPASVRQYHYLGKRDQNIKAAMINPVVTQQENSSLSLLDDYGHDCCWETDWPVFLSKW